MIHRAKRQALNQNERDEKSKIIAQRIMDSFEFQHASKIAIYQSINDEVDLSFLRYQNLSINKIFYFPIMQAHQSLAFLPASLDTPFKFNSLNIPEPNLPLHLAVDPHEIELFLIPLVAFDRHGSRIGMGGGYYDRSLSRLKTASFMGVGFEVQRTEYIEPDAWDIRLDAIITEKKIYRTQGDKNR